MIQSSENSLVLPLRTSGVIFLLILAASVSVFVPPLLVLASLVAVALVWAIFRYPIAALGLVIAFMPIDFMAIATGKFFGLPKMTLISACTKEIPLSLLALFLWWRNRFKPTVPDWLLLGCFSLACLRTLFGGTAAGLWLDFSFIFPYFIGRITILTAAQEQLWARCAVWIAAILSALGLFEVFIFGEGPRTLLYLAVDTGGTTEQGTLTASFHGQGFVGMREAATMVGPNSFGVLCMIALILWWVYCRSPLPATMIVTGLICCVTRADWFGTVAAIPVLAVVMGQRKRFFLYGALALSLFVASIPILGLKDYLSLSKTGGDLSSEYHQDAVTNGLKFAAEHPLGAGNSDLNPGALNQNSNATIFETTYPYLAAEYGIVVGTCFVAFLFSATCSVWRIQSRLGYAALGILIGISVVMIFALTLNDRRLAYWVFFPVGLAIRSGQTETSSDEHADGLLPSHS